MLTSPAAGRFLELLVAVSGARRVLEIGTYTGHSALAMAAALPDDGELITCELDPDRAAFAREHIDQTPLAGRIEIRVGPALDTIAGLDGEFDLVFIDADKPGYPGYVDAVLPKLATGGLIVLDNMLMGGEVLDAEQDESTRVIHALNERLASDPSLIAVLVPLRDGMTVVRRA
jgi:caffeoyl-CoA O-methyltransferase